MPFGKYRGRLLIDLSEPYVVWFRGQGYPAGELGTMMASLYEIKANGLEGLLRQLMGCQREIPAAATTDHYHRDSWVNP